jgi:hypothetical protein
MPAERLSGIFHGPRCVKGLVRGILVFFASIGTTGRADVREHQAQLILPTGGRYGESLQYGQRDHCSRFDKCPLHTGTPQTTASLKNLFAETIQLSGQIK